MKKQLLFLTIITLFFSSCVEDQITSNFSCDKKGRDLGNFFLMPESEEFWVYEPGQKLYFQDSLGNELVFEEETLSESLEPRIVRTVCGAPNLPEFEQDVMKTMVKRIHYTVSNNNNLFINYSVRVSLFNVTEDSESFYDQVSISLRRSNFNFLSSKRGYDFDTPDYLWFGRYEQVDTTILGRSFNDAYFFKDQNDNFFNRAMFNKEKGVISFYDRNNTLFVLDRIE